MGKNKDEHRTLNSHACLTRWGLFWNIYYNYGSGGRLFIGSAKIIDMHACAVRAVLFLWIPRLRLTNCVGQQIWHMGRCTKRPNKGPCIAKNKGEKYYKIQKVLKGSYKLHKGILIRRLIHPKILGMIYYLLGSSNKLFHNNQLKRLI